MSLAVVLRAGGDAEVSALRAAGRRVTTILPGAAGLAAMAPTR